MKFGQIFEPKFKFFIGKIIQESTVLFTGYATRFDTRNIRKFFRETRKIERVAGPVNRTVPKSKIFDFFFRIFRFPYLLEADIEIETLIYKLIIFQTSFWRFQPFFLDQFHFRWLILTLPLYEFGESSLHRKCNL